LASDKSIAALFKNIIFFLALSTENSPMKTWAGSRASYGKQSRIGTRARHLSDFVQVEDLKNKNYVRSASMSASKFYIKQATLEIQI